LSSGDGGKIFPAAAADDSVAPPRSRKTDDRRQCRRLHPLSAAVAAFMAPDRWAVQARIRLQADQLRPLHRAGPCYWPGARRGVRDVRKCEMTFAARSFPATAVAVVVVAAAGECVAA